MTESNFLRLYNMERMLADYSFAKQYRNLFFFTNKKEKRIWHRAWFWFAWLRHKRWLRLKTPTLYITSIMTNRNDKEARGYDYINSLDMGN